MSGLAEVFTLGASYSVHEYGVLVTWGSARFGCFYLDKRVDWL